MKFFALISHLFKNLTSKVTGGRDN